MKTEKEIEEKIESLEKYLEKQQPISKLYPLEKTVTFKAALEWVLED